MKKIALLVGLIALVAVFGFAGSANAAGAYVGTGLGYSLPNADFNEDEDIDLKVETDGGFSWEYLHVGYNFNDNMGVNLLWGQASGTGEVSAMGESEDLDWDNDYLNVNFRYTFPMDSISPYLEAGLGSYSLSAESDHVSVDLDPVIGYRLGVGGIVPISQFYIAPELSYHFVEYDEGEGDIDGLGSGNLEDAGDGNFGLFSVKIGYMFGK